MQRWLDGSLATPCPGVADLEELVYSQRRRLEIEWMRGHNGHPLNETADWLARKARARACSRGMALAACPIRLEGSLVEVLVSDGESTVGHRAGFVDNPEDEETVDLVLRSEWQDGPAGAHIAFRVEEIGLQ